MKIEIWERGGKLVSSKRASDCAAFLSCRLPLYKTHLCCSLHHSREARSVSATWVKLIGEGRGGRKPLRASSSREGEGTASFFTRTTTNNMAAPTERRGWKVRRVERDRGSLKEGNGKEMETLA